MVTQLLFYYCIILPLTFATTAQDNIFYLLLLSLASLLIAAAGYIINDYFDLNIDRVNKPERLVVEKIIKRRWAIIWHWALSFAGIAISVYLGFKLGQWIVALANTICVIVLWFYSTSFKKKLLIGNVIISLLTAWVILVLFVYRTAFPVVIKINSDTLFALNVAKFFKLTVLYSGFAFIISLIREVIKDMEDMEGDAKYGCKTMPIVWGIPASKVFVAVWLIVLVGAIIILQFYALHLQWWGSVIYSVITIILPLLWILHKLYTAKVAADYHVLSTVVKMVMLAGILSMLFFKVYS